MVDQHTVGLRMAACLAHTVPGVTLTLSCERGQRLLVSQVCLGAELDPCALRTALLAPRQPGVPHVTDVVTDVDVTSGLVDLGGGLYERSHPCSPSERWFATTLDHPHVAGLLTGSDAADAAISAALKPDLGLGVCAVCIRSVDERHRGELDELATWALSTCMVAELLADIPAHS